MIGSGYGKLDMNLTTDSFGAVVRSDVFMDCDRTSCSISGSGVELVGIGGAKVSGKVVVQRVRRRLRSLPAVVPALLQPALQARR